MINRIVLLMMATITQSAFGDLPWAEFPGGDGPGKPYRIVLISGDEEYRSEEALPQLAKILSQHHGFNGTVLFAIDPDTGFLNPNNQNHIPGLEALDDADLMVIATRFRDLPEESMAHIERYLRSGRPVIGLRTATHAFKIPAEQKYAHYSDHYNGEKQEWVGGFGRLVLGECWVAHHGKHKHQGTRGIIPSSASQHPITRGIDQGSIWGPSDVYRVRTPLPDEAQTLVLGGITSREGDFDPEGRWFGMQPDDPLVEQEESELMPIAWLKNYQIPDGEPGLAFTTTMGASTDLESPGLRRLLVNAVYFLLNIPLPEEATNVALVGKYEPSAYGFRDDSFFLEKKLRPQDFEANTTE